MTDFSKQGVSLFTIPSNPVSSNRFRERFNAVAKELKLGLEWVKDEKNPLAVDADELRVAAAAVTNYQLQSSIPSQFNPNLLRDVTLILRTVEEQRLAAVEASALYHRRVNYRAPLEQLSPVERRALELFALRVMPVLTRIEQRQHDPKAPEHGVWLALHGDYYSKILFQRFNKDNCAGPYGGDKACSLVPFFPDSPPVNGMIDSRITPDEFRAMGAALPPKAEELRPTTVLTKGADHKIVATPLPLHPDYKQDHQLLAAVLEEIADLSVEGKNLDPSLRTQLQRWAMFFRTGLAADEAAAAQATIDAGEGGGMLRVHIGPSESYWEDNTKFPYLLQVGVRDVGLAAELEKGKEAFPALERLLNDIPHYQPRELSTRGGLADPLYHAIIGGFVWTFPSREPAGNNFPNYEGYGVEGSNRFIWLETISEIARSAPVVMGGLLDEDFTRWDARKNIIQDTVDHESGHLIGPLRSHVTPSGERMGALFGKHWGSADEPKADLTGPQRVRLEHRAGKISDAEARDLLRGTLFFHLGNRYKGKAAFGSGDLTDHYYGHMIQVGWYFKTGALTLIEQKNRLHMDYKRMEDASHELWKKIIAFQAAGDLKGYLKFGAELVAAIPDKADQMILEANRGQRLIFIERHL
ncbi:MAG: hypothetical protein HYU97_01625 [Deltaproteobacteria bacterium]|nr:hypothetical protein [Deltaproteobacteria bacterium]